MQIGLERLAGSPRTLRRLRAQRVGLLSHAAAVDRRLAHATDVLAELGVRLSLLFGPEHGWGAEAQDMASVGGGVHAETGLPLVSLYGETFDDLSPKAEHLAEIDVLVIDLTDVGSRYYTFVWTALLAQRAAQKAGVVTVVLDRPNPLGCARATVEGATQKPGYLSFVGLEPLPVRHALTLGEIVCLFASRDGVPLGDAGGLSVVGVAGWEREQLAGAWDRPFVMPSPNMPTAATALVYPGGCLLEGTNLSEGRGTTRPFELVGAPWLDERALARALTETTLPGFIARPASFRPMFQKHAGEICRGVEVHVTDPSTFRPVATYAALVAAAHAQSPEQFRFRTERYEYVDTIPAFDLLTGSADCRHAIALGDAPGDVAEAVSRPDPEYAAVMAEARAAMQMADPVSGF
ncbi:MAG TPA: DUF1343 domain-containing protein [Byssovorax sp.]|jgi:uncharacterized protein YbbC (DUF1343 family)